MRFSGQCTRNGPGSTTDLQGERGFMEIQLIRVLMK